MSPGTILAGKYRLVSLLGRGGMGSVWRAERLGWQAPVAIKLMNLSPEQDAQTLIRFQREARLAASLRSIHVVQVLDDGVDPSTGAPFIVMELLEGETLAERLQRVKMLRPPVVAQVVSQIARALGRAHDAGLIHRDLKPDNILIVRNDDEEVIKVLDFGIAKWMAAPQKAGHGTLAGQMLGTPAYMSPEHFAGSVNIDHRADLWSLGVVAFECITGKRPFDGETLVRLAVQICTEAPPRPSRRGSVPDGFDAWFVRAVARDVKDRFPSARIMAEELRGLCGQIPMLWEPDAIPPREHASRERTELEPVLELTRRVRDSSSVPPEPRRRGTEHDSMEPMLRTANLPAPTRRPWLGISALLIIVSGFLYLALLPELSPTSFERLSLGIRNLTSSLQPGVEPSELPVAPASPPAPPADGALLESAAPPPAARNAAFKADERDAAAAPEPARDAGATRLGAFPE